MKCKHLSAIRDALAKFEERCDNKQKQIILEIQRDVKRDQKHFVGLASQTQTGRNCQALCIVPVKVEQEEK